MNRRKYYLDNIRWGTVLLVILYHVIYLFNSVGVISNINVQGIPQMDVLMYFVYPWFMNLLFVVAGVSAWHSLSARNGREFIRERVKRLLVPSIAGIFLLGWVNGWVTNQYVDMFAGNGEGIPGFVKYLVYCLCGIGPLWFAHELFLASLVLVLFRAVDKEDRLRELGGRANPVGLLLLAFVVWGSSKILNTPVIEVYRNGIYIFMFLLGYYVFSHEEVIEILARYCVILLLLALLTGIGYTIYYYGENYSTRECLESFFTNFYAWIMILAILGCGKSWFDKKNILSDYMMKRNFGFYVLHYPLLVMIAYVVTTYFSLPMLLNYIVILLLEIVFLPLFYETISRIPLLNMLLLGKR